MVENLLRDYWAALEQGELRVVLSEHIIGGKGQYDGRAHAQQSSARYAQSRHRGMGKDKEAQEAVTPIPER